MEISKEEIYKKALVDAQKEIYEHKISKDEPVNGFRKILGYIAVIAFIGIICFFGFMLFMLFTKG